MICLRNSFDAVIEKKASQINELMGRDFDNGATISGSIGIAVYPRDGRSYDQIYSRVDIALYQAKEAGKDRYVFYRDGMTRSESAIVVEEKAEDESGRVSKEHSVIKKKLLVVDDVESNREMITQMVQDEYTVLQAKDGRRALLTLRRYGTAISAVLLDLMMPGMDGFEVLRSMQREPILKSIPVIIVSGASNEANEFKAIEMARGLCHKSIDRVC